MSDCSTTNDKGNTTSRAINDPAAAGSGDPAATLLDLGTTYTTDIKTTTSSSQATSITYVLQAHRCRRRSCTECGKHFGNELKQKLLTAFPETTITMITLSP